MRSLLCTFGIGLVCLAEASTGAFVFNNPKIASRTGSPEASAYLDRQRPITVPLQRQGSRAQLLRSNSQLDLVPPQASEMSASNTTPPSIAQAPGAREKLPRSSTCPFLLSEESPAEEETTVEAEERASQEARRSQAEFLALQEERERLRMESKQLKQERDAHRLVLRQKMAAMEAAGASDEASCSFQRRMGGEEEERFNKVLERRAAEESARVARLHAAMNEKVKLWEDGFEEVVAIAEEIDQAKFSLAFEAKLRAKAKLTKTGTTPVPRLRQSASRADPVKDRIEEIRKDAGGKEANFVRAQERASSVQRELVQERARLEEREWTLRRKLQEQAMLARLSAETGVTFESSTAAEERVAVGAGGSRSPSPAPAS